MTDEKHRSLSRYVEPPMDDLAIEKQWIAIRERRAQKGRGWLRVWAAGGLFVASAAALAVVWSSAGAPAAPLGATVTAAAGAVIESGGEPVTVALADGSHVALEPGTRVEHSEAPGRDVRLELRRGRATFDVARDPARTFSIGAGQVTVVVVGTRFSVQHDPGRVEVAVERGIVEVRTPHETHRLRAGERWSGASEPPGVAIEAPPADDEEVAPEPRRREGPSASELFEQARGARREGDDRAAALAYDQLLRRYPRDGHAGLAAFELARIRLDALDDPRGAIDPLERAVAARVFPEDALARLVEATDRAGQSGRCRSARERYLRDYPEGVHRGAVEARCP